MIRTATIILLVALLAGCQKVEGTPTPEPTRLDCDLIFPGPGAA